MLTSRPLALITGASSGIGAAFARRLAHEGYDLLLVARDKLRLERLSGELRKQYGIAIETLPADLALPSEIQRVEARIAAAPVLTMLVNNAGFITTEHFAASNPAAQEAMITLHATASMRLAHAALPAMLARRSGTIINVSSIAAFVPGPTNVTYSATKAFLNIFTEGLAFELRGSGVHVMALCPGWTRTALHSRVGYDVSGVPASLWREPEQVVETALRAVRRRRLYCFPNSGDYWRILLYRLAPRRLLRPLRHALRLALTPLRLMYQNLKHRVRTR